MIDLKTDQEIQIMSEGGKRLKKVVDVLLQKIKVGITTEEIDNLAENLIIKEGGEPSFKKVEGYHWATCLPINEQVVHTPPSKRKLKRGDVLTLDIGMYYQGYHTDYATTFVAGDFFDKKIEEFLKTGKIALEKAIGQAKVGNRLGDISLTIEKEIEGKGYFVMRELTGHGIGKSLHEEPYVLGYLDRPKEKTMKIKLGLTIAIEVIYSLGTRKIAYENNDYWSIISQDRTLTACFEKTIAVTEKKTLVLT